MLKMKNLVNLYSGNSNINGGLFIKRLRYRLNGDYVKNYTKCNCPAAAIHHLTPINTYNKDIRDHFRKHDIRNRFYSSNSGPPSTKLPPLMNFPEIMWPSLIKSIRNFILATFIIKPYFDKDFSLADFVLGSKRALEVVSSKISQGEIKSLEGLVSGEVMQSIQKALPLMSVFQREQIAVNSEDIFFSFPYQVGIIFNETDSEQKRFVEITMVFHSLRGFAAMKERGEEIPFNIGMMPEYQRRMAISNYRFVREYTKGTENDWTINLLNHFKPSDLLED